MMSWQLVGLIAAVATGGILGMWLFGKFLGLPPVWQEATAQ